VDHSLDASFECCGKVFFAKIKVPYSFYIIYYKYILSLHSWVHSEYIYIYIYIYKSGVTNLFETESYFMVQIHAKGDQFDTHTSEIKFAKFVFNCVIMNIN